MGALRVLIADDSPIFLEVFRQVLEADGDIQVVAAAISGERAVEEARRHRPDLVTVDLNMPGQDGLATVERIMSERPVPIVVVTAQPVKGERDLVFESTRRGALEIVDKRVVCASPAEQARLRRLLLELGHVQVIRHPRAATSPAPSALLARIPTPLPSAARAEGCPVVALGASAGGPMALARVLGLLPAGLPACVAVVQHLGAGFVHPFAQFLQGSTALRVRVVAACEPLEPGVVLLPDDACHLVADGPRHLRSSDAPPVRYYRPSIDSLFSSLAKEHGARAVGALLTGIGDDGARGLLEMRQAGAATFAQDEASSAVYGMPRAAMAMGAAQQALPPERLAAALVEAIAARKAVRPP